MTQYAQIEATQRNADHNAPEGPAFPDVLRLFLAQWMILFVVLLAIGAVFASNLSEDRARLLTMAANQLTRTASSVAKTIERRFALIDAALQDLRAMLPEYKQEQDGDAHLLRHMETLKRSSPGVQATLLTNTDGIVIVSDRKEFIGRRIPEVGEITSTGPSSDLLTPHISHAFTTAGTDKAIARGQIVLDAKGKFIGTVIALIDLHDLQRMAESLNYAPDVNVALFQGSKKILFSTSNGLLRSGGEISQRQFLPPPSPLEGIGKPVFLVKSPQSSREMLAATDVIPTRSPAVDYTLTAVASQNIADIMRPWHETVRWLALLFFLLLTASSASLFLYQRRQRKTHVLIKGQHEESQRLAERLRLATEASHTGIWELDTQSGTLIWDDTMLALYGVSREEWTATHADWRKCVLPEDLPTAEISLRHAIEQGNAIDAQFRIRRGDGAIRHIHAHARIHGTANSQHGKVIGTNRDITEQKEIEQALRENKDFAISVLDSMIEQVAVLDEQGTIVSVNQAWRNFSDSNGGADETRNPAGKNYLDVCATSQRNSCPEAAMIAAAIRGVIDRKLVNFDYEYDAHSPERKRWFNMHVTPLHGARLGAVVVHEDITTRKEAENDLIHAQQMTQQFLDHLPGAAFIKDENLRVLMANNSFRSILGVDPSAIIGKTNTEIFPGDFGHRLDADDHAVLQSGHAQIFEEEFCGRTLESIKFPIRDESGCVKLGGVTSDITGRKRHFELQEIQLKINALARTMPEQEFLARGLRMLTELTGSSMGFLKIVGKTSDRMDLVAWIELTSENKTFTSEPSPQDQAWANALSPDEIQIENDGHVNVGNGERGLIRHFIAAPVIEENKPRLIAFIGNKSEPYDDLDGTCVQLIASHLSRIAQRVRSEEILVKQMEELKTLNRKLEEAQSQLLQSEKMAAIGQLAAGVAHELNNPISFVHSNLGSLSGYLGDLIAIVDAYSEIDARQPAGQPSNFDPVHRLKQSVDFDFIVHDIPHLLAESKDGLERVRKIVSDLKGFSRVGESEWQWADLHQGLESTLNIVWNEIKYKAELIREYGNLPQVYCIPSQINQVFMNLLTNAAQAIPEFGRIVLRSGREGDSVWIEIEDNGMGIAPEHMERIFDPFFTTKPVGKGTGLGLSLSWGIVKNHHGTLNVTSQPGQGTKFRMTLPVEHRLQSESEPSNSEAS